VTLQQILDAILGQAGVIVLLLIILWAGWKRYWVFGSYYTEMRDQLREQLLEERKEAKARYERAVGAVESNTGLLERTIRQAEGRQGERSD
jgi:hypothetical protein